MKLAPARFSLLRWVPVLWLAVWLPAYAHYWGWANFLHSCDIGVILSAAGFFLGNSLLLSSQAVGNVLADLLWCFDAASRLVSGKHLLGGTEYMWDSHFPVWLRLLSLFHIFLPVLLVWSLRRAGYDRRGLPLQGAILAGLLVVSRFFGQEQNLNYAYIEPIFHRFWGPALLHIFLVWLWMLIFLYLPVHFALVKLMPESKMAAHPNSHQAAL